MKAEGYSGACWGYNFDWQARRLFLFKKNTPTVVATAFSVEALVESYEITKDEDVLKTIDLQRILFLRIYREQRMVKAFSFHIVLLMVITP